MDARKWWLRLSSVAAVLSGCNAKLNEGLNKFARPEAISSPETGRAPNSPVPPMDNGRSNQGTDTSPKPNADAVSAPAALSLAGTWATGCYKASNTSYKKEVAVITEKSLSATVSDYRDALCTPGQEDMRQRILNEYTITADSGPASGVSNIEYKSMQIFVTLLSEQMVNNFNQFFRSSTPWILGVEQDATSVLSSNDSNDPNSKVEKLYSIFKLNGNTLCLGDATDNSDNGTTEEKRHKKLDTDSACLTKKP